MTAYGRLTLASTLVSGITSGATSVAITGVWTTTGYPFDFLVGGERLTATAASVGGGNTTLTVTRSVNGVVKAHSAGAAVTLAEPFRLGLGAYRRS